MLFLQSMNVSYCVSFYYYQLPANTTVGFNSPICGLKCLNLKCYLTSTSSDHLQQPMPTFYLDCCFYVTTLLRTHTRSFCGTIKWMKLSGWYREGNIGTRKKSGHHHKNLLECFHDNSWPWWSQKVTKIERTQLNWEKKVQKIASTMFPCQSPHSGLRIPACCWLEASALMIYINCCLQLFATACCGLFLVVIIYQPLFIFGLLLWTLEGRQHKINTR